MLALPKDTVKLGNTLITHFYPSHRPHWASTTFADRERHQPHPTLTRHGLNPPPRPPPPSPIGANGDFESLTALLPTLGFSTTFAGFPHHKYHPFCARQSIGYLTRAARAKQQYSYGILVLVHFTSRPAHICPLTNGHLAYPRRPSRKPIIGLIRH
jgi:hypothetical protein